MYVYVFFPLAKRTRTERRIGTPKCHAPRSQLQSLIPCFSFSFSLFCYPFSLPPFPPSSLSLSSSALPPVPSSFFGFSLSIILHSLFLHLLSSSFYSSFPSSPFPSPPPPTSPSSLPLHPTPPRSSHTLFSPSTSSGAPRGRGVPCRARGSSVCPSYCHPAGVCFRGVLRAWAAV